MYNYLSDVPVAQLDRVFGYEPKGWGLDSLRAHQKNRRTISVAIFSIKTYTHFINSMLYYKCFINAFVAQLDRALPS